MGVARPSRSTTSPSPTCSRRCARRRGHDRGDAARRRPDPRRSASATSSAPRGRRCSAPPRWPASTTRCASSGPPSTPGSRRTSRSSSTLATPTPRVDSLRSTRTVRVESHGVVLAESSSPVLCFETGSPPATTSTGPTSTSPSSSPPTPSPRAPTRGRRPGTGRRWWTGAPTRTSRGPTTSRPATCCPSPGLIAFYNEKVDTFLDGVRARAPAHALLLSPRLRALLGHRRAPA